jgi:hypothetical protein
VLIASQFAGRGLSEFCQDPEARNAEMLARLSFEANPLEFGGAPIRVHIMPVIPRQPSVSDAINANFDRVHFDITNDYDQDVPLQSRDEDEENGDEGLDHLLGDDDPERTALLDELNRYVAFEAKARSLRNQLANDFLESKAGKAAKKAIDEAHDDLQADIEAAERRYQRKSDAAARKEGKKFGKHSPGFEAAEAWLRDQIAELTKEFAELREAILEAEMMAKDPKLGARFVDLINSINQANEVMSVINQQIEAIDQAEAAPESETPPKSVEKAKNAPGK